MWGLCVIAYGQAAPVCHSAQQLFLSVQRSEDIVSAAGYSWPNTPECTLFSSWNRLHWCHGISMLWSLTEWRLKPGGALGQRVRRQRQSQPLYCFCLWGLWGFLILVLRCSREATLQALALLCSSSVVTDRGDTLARVRRLSVWQCVCVAFGNWRLSLGFSFELFSWSNIQVYFQCFVYEQHMWLTISTFIVIFKMTKSSHPVYTLKNAGLSQPNFGSNMD